MAVLIYETTTTSVFNFLQLVLNKLLNDLRFSVKIKQDANLFEVAFISSNVVPFFVHPLFLEGCKNSSSRLGPHKPPYATQIAFRLDEVLNGSNQITRHPHSY